ncbi:MAG: TIGR03862 family flavoprotein [Methylobacter sp.]|nr:TIGR03862 family flavoprotein [Methylobacter sp.]MDP2100448.1 TIGR03862 family flavoprotein [Methylobacter sp.]MDP2428308.1 TIGR03862 family flavoprotein [Methylobacter sp.]MDP3055659.1 TIGR03862 family flavoprotein [Methylobacter sp.]MDP3361405.1 TIGR03862 family flavoprotein [Methylobacter sp.]
MPESIGNTVAIIGGGPAGLMAAEVLSQAGVKVDLYDAMPSVGRKFLMAGKGGMNITHSEPMEAFLSRYGARQAYIKPLLDAFSPEALRAWLQGLGIETFVGSSGKVFPVDMKAAPLLRAWLQRLRANGVRFYMRHQWLGWETGGLRFLMPDGEKTVNADAVVLALGGGSWARLGSTGAWLPLLVELGVSVALLQPSNCGFDVAWSDFFRSRFAGQPLKSVVASFGGSAGDGFCQRGELLVTADGVEGSLIYKLSAMLRDHIAASGSAWLYLDLAPGKDQAFLFKRLSKPRGKLTMANHLRKRVGIEGIKAALLREVLAKADFDDPARLAAAIKALPLKLLAARPIDEAISTAGGVSFEALDQHLMLRAMPGVFCAGEMLDWEAPTGGYLLTACFASGHVAGAGVLAWLQHSVHQPNKAS